MKLIHWPTFIITIIICIIILFIFVYLRLKIPLDCHFSKIDKEKLINEVKTGDILAVAYGSKRAKLVKVFTGSMWAHSAIIVKLNKPNSRPYVLEVARYSSTNRGIMVTELGKWLEDNSHNRVAMSYLCKGDIPDNKLSLFLQSHEGIREEMFVLKWLAAMFKRSYRYKTSKQVSMRKRFCSELVAYFLQECGVLKKKYRPNGYKPWELLYGDLDLHDGYSYSKPKLII